MPSFQRSNGIPSATIPSTRLEAALAERGERRRAAVVVALVAVRPEAEQPRRQCGQVARPEVEGRVGPQQRPQAVDREPRLRQRARLRGRDPAAVAPRGGGARPDARAVDDRDVDVASAQVVGAAEPGDAPSDDDGLHDGMPAVASTSTSIPGTVKPVTIVVRTGRGAGSTRPRRRSTRRSAPGRGGSTARAARARARSLPRRETP